MSRFTSFRVFTIRKRKLDWLEERKAGYVIKVKLRNLTRLLVRQCWSSLSNQPGWEQCEFKYQCKNWKTKRKMVAVRRENQDAMMKLKQSDQKTMFNVVVYDYFCYVVSEDWTPWKAHQTYGQRATYETWIEEAKNQMALGKIRTDCFLANAYLFQASILAYSTLRWMGLCSGKKELRKWEPKTIRAFLIRLAGKLLTGCRRLELRISKNTLYEEERMAWFAIGMT